MSAQILPFQLRARTSQRHAKDALPPPAIIIFPGVRYERWSDEEAAARSAASIQPQLSAPHHC